MLSCMDNIVESIPQSTVSHNFSNGDKFSPSETISKDVEKCGKLSIVLQIRGLQSLFMWENM